jgi:hypothetical protein
MIHSLTTTHTLSILGLALAILVAVGLIRAALHPRGFYDLRTPKQKKNGIPVVTYMIDRKTGETNAVIVTDLRDRNPKI